MIRQCFYLERYKWTVHAFYDVGDNDIKEIFEALKYVGCGYKQLMSITDNIEDGLLNNGFTYSNCVTRLTVLVVGESTSNEEAMNSLVHEARHLERHISKTFGIEEDSEEPYYLIGKLIQVMYSRFKLILD